MVGLVASTKLPPAPLIILHAPVPTPGALAARVTEVNPQVAALVWSGPAADTVGAAVIVTTVVPAALVQPFVVDVTEKVPAYAVVTPGIVGFCVDDVKLFGPFHE